MVATAFLYLQAHGLVARGLLEAHVWAPIGSPRILKSSNMWLLLGASGVPCATSITQHQTEQVSDWRGGMFEQQVAISAPLIIDVVQGWLLIKVTAGQF